jgi:small GTP-binding protein
MKPVLALVGRPNVGKSTLFNRLTKSRDAIVADHVGLTRDRHYGQARLGPQAYIVIDTGGFEPTAESGIYKEMARQTRQAVAEADVVVFVVDAREGLSAQDHDIARYLRKLGKPSLLVANKAEGMKAGAQLAEFFELGLGDVLAVSASHGQGVRSMVEAALGRLALPPLEEETDEQEQPLVVKLAVAGRPNVGKSTLINTWLGEERLVAFDLPGTTRDAISVPFERDGQRFELIDTAGLRQNTLVLFKSDNGGYNGDNRPLRGIKGMLYEGGIRIPWIVRWPSKVQPGTTNTTPVISMDCYPTLLDIAALPPTPDHPLDGQSLLPLLTKSLGFSRDSLCFHYPNYAFHKENRLGSAIREGNFKLLRFSDDNSLELYNLDSDIGEQNNLAPTSPDLANRLAAKLDTWLKARGAQFPTKSAAQ